MTPHQVVGKPDIKIVEAGSLDNPSLDFFPECGNLIPNKGVIKDLEIRLDRFGGNATVGGNVGVVQHFPVGDGGNLHETLERIKLSHFPFFPDFFIEIDFHVAGQTLSGIFYHIMSGQHPVLHGTVNLKVRHFRPHKRIKRFRYGASAKGICSGPLELSGTGTAKDKIQAFVHHQGMYHVQQFRDLLNLVHHDKRTGGFVLKSLPKGVGV